jgi:prepilin peptidase CpaA
MVGGFEIALWLLLVIATITDLRWGKIFNATTFPFLVLGLGARAYTGGSPAFLESLGAVGVAFILLFPLYMLKALSAADVKLLMAVGAWTNYKVVLQLAMASILFGALVGLVILIRQAGLKGGAKSLREHLRARVVTSGHRMPFAPAFLCGFMFLKIAETYRWFGL